MKHLAPAVTIFTATPAFAHHEAIVIGSAMGPIAGLTVVLLAGIVGWRRRRAS
ncbi:LPXTG cell wall anchor domain-containing protein [Roseobacter sp.]|uniref:LPXTG cell wall anchor domain-containing protein n=1 Tax=Roseobacter sp. TaxID=1907202 RepID=UPI003298CBDB